MSPTTVNVALNAARQSTDPRIKAQLQNLKKWTRTYRNAKKTRDTFNKYLAPFDNAVELHVSTMHSLFGTSIVRNTRRSLSTLNTRAADQRSKNHHKDQETVSVRHGWSGLN